MAPRYGPGCTVVLELDLGEAKLGVDVELAFDASIGACCCSSWLAGHWGALEGRGLRPEPGSFSHAKIGTWTGPFEEAESRGVLLLVS